MRNLIPALLVGLALTAHARVGESRAECDKRYGKPVFVGKGHADYSTRVCGVSVDFGRNGRVEAETYYFRNSTSPDADRIVELAEKNFGIGATVDLSTRLRAPDKYQELDGDPVAFPVYPKVSVDSALNPGMRRPVGYMVLLVANPVYSTVKYTFLTPRAYFSRLPDDQKDGVCVGDGL